MRFNLTQYSSNRRVGVNASQYSYRLSAPIHGLAVQLFQSAREYSLYVYIYICCTSYIYISNHAVFNLKSDTNILFYLISIVDYGYGIRLCQKSTNETVIMFNARNELDQSRFADDLSESIAEMDEMMAIKSRNIVEILHFKFTEKIYQHSLMHKKFKKSPSGLIESNKIDLTSSDPHIGSRTNCDIIKDGGSQTNIASVDDIEKQSATNPVKTTNLVNGHANRWTKSNSISSLSSLAGSDESGSGRQTGSYVTGKSGLVCV